MPLDKFFKPIANYELVRIGRSNDGGYLIKKKKINSSKYLIRIRKKLDW